MKKGISFALLTAIISGVSVFLNGIGVSFGDPFVYTTLKNGLVVVFLLSFIFLFSKRKELSALTQNQWKDLLFIGVIGGGIPFLLFFYGLSIGTAASTSFIYRALFISAGVLGIVWLKEQFDIRYALGAAIIFIGNFLLLKGNFVFGLGELLVLISTLLWSIEYAYSRKVLETVSPSILAFGRMLFGSAILIGFTLVTGKFGQLFTANLQSYYWALLASVFLFGFVLSWYTSLKYTTLSKATAIFVIGGPITAALQFIFLNKIFTFTEGLGLLLIVVGVAIDTVSQVESHLISRNYDGFLGAKGGRFKGRKA